MFSTTQQQQKVESKKIFNLDKLMKNHTIRIIMKKKMANEEKREEKQRERQRTIRDGKRLQQNIQVHLCCVLYKCGMYTYTFAVCVSQHHNGAPYLVCRLHLLGCLLAYIFRDGGCFCIEYSGSYIQSMFMCINLVDVFVRVYV